MFSIKHHLLDNSATISSPLLELNNQWCTFKLVELGRMTRLSCVFQSATVRIAMRYRIQLLLRCYTENQRLSDAVGYKMITEFLVSLIIFTTDQKVYHCICTPTNNICVSRFRLANYFQNDFYVYINRGWSNFYVNWV